MERLARFIQLGDDLLVWQRLRFGFPYEGGQRFTISGHSFGITFGYPLKLRIGENHWTNMLGLSHLVKHRLNHLKLIGVGIDCLNPRTRLQWISRIHNCDPVPMAQ